MKTLTLISFSYRLGIPTEVTVPPVDIRFLLNPYNVPDLKNLTGLDPRVQAYVQKTRSFKEHFEQWTSVALGLGAGAFGCVGGRHRSVSVVEMMAKRLREEGHRVEVKHYGLNTELYLQQARPSVTL